MWESPGREEPPLIRVESWTQMTLEAQCKQGQWGPWHTAESPIWREQQLPAEIWPQLLDILYFKESQKPKFLFCFLFLTLDS